MSPISCQQFRDKLHPLIDGELTADEREACLQHIEACEPCRQEYEQLLDIRDLLGHMDDDLETPLGFEQGWRAAVRQESRTGRSRRWIRALSGIAAGFLLLAGATVINRRAAISPADMLDAASASPAPYVDTVDTDNSFTQPGNEEGAGLLAAAARRSIDPQPTAQPVDGIATYLGTADTAPQYNYSRDDALGATSAGSGLLDVNTDGAGTLKVLRSATLAIETESFDDDMKAIKAQVARYGGLFERNAIAGDTGSRIAELTLRVPAGFLESFVEQIRGIGRVLSSDVSAQDITPLYTDTALKLDTYRVQLNRVKELTAQANDLNEVLELEAEASRLQYEIDTLTGALMGWDGQTEMSTVNVVLTEYTRANAMFGAGGFGSQLGDQFNQSMGQIGSFLGDMLLTAVALLPHLLWAVPLAVIAVLLHRLYRKNGYHYKKRHAD